MDGTVVAFVGICLAIVAYAAITLWSWFATWMMRTPSVFVIDPRTLPVSLQRRIRHDTRRIIAAHLRRQYSVKLHAHKRASESVVVPVVRDCNAELSTSDNRATIDDNQVRTLHNLIAAGLVTNRAKAICATFNCTVQSASRPDSVYQQVLKRLEALDGETGTAAPIVTRQLRISAKSGVQYVPMEP